MIFRLDRPKKSKINVWALFSTIVLLVALFQEREDILLPPNIFLFLDLFQDDFNTMLYPVLYMDGSMYRQGVCKSEQGSDTMHLQCDTLMCA